MTLNTSKCNHLMPLHFKGLIFTLQQSAAHVTGSRSSHRRVVTERQQDNSGPISDSRNALAAGADALIPGLEKFVTEEHQPGFKLRVRFVAADCPRRAAGGHNPSTGWKANSGSTTTRISTSVDTRADVQHRLID